MLKGIFKSKCKRELSLIVFLAFSPLFSLAQTPYPGCPNVDATPDDGSLSVSQDSIYLECGHDCIDLTAEYLETGETNKYRVGSIPFNPPFSFVGGTPLFIGADDEFTNGINLPFDFCFYGGIYNQIVVGANGLISFDMSLAGGPCDYVITTPIPSPPPSVFGPGIYGLSINGAVHDIQPNKCGDINYSVLGSYPCRTFVVNFTDVCHYHTNCPAANYKTTQQIVIYETTNVIEVYLKNKPSCPAWEGGRAAIGIQNLDGTVGIAAPGRNTSVWTANNEAWRFTPDGAPNYVFHWEDENGNDIGSNKSINVCMPDTDPHNYTAIVEYTNCNGNKITETKTLVVVPKGDITANIDNTTDVLCKDSCDGSVAIAITEGEAPFSVVFPSGDTLSGLNHGDLCAGSYAIEVIDQFGCNTDLNFTIDEPEPIAFTFTSTETSCGSSADGTLTIATISGGVAPYAILWDGGSTDSTITGAAGNYEVTITDDNGCFTTLSGEIPAGPEPSITLQAIPTSCFGGTDGQAIVNTISDATPPYNFSWSNGDSDSIADGAAGMYVVTFSDAGGCDVVDSIPITEPDIIVLDTNLKHLSCPDALDGEIQVMAYGGTPPFTYSLDNVNFSASSTFSNLAHGPYTVYVSDNNGCTASINVNLTTDLVSVQAPGDVAVCPGEFINLAATGDFVTVNWSNGLVDGEDYYPSHSGTVPFVVTAQNASGCKATDTVLVTVHPQYDATIIPAGPFCTIEEDFQVMTNAPDGNWSGAVSATGMFSPGSAGPGTHEVIYSFFGFCPTSDTIQIDVNDSFDAAINPVEPTCILNDPFDLTSATNGGEWFGNGIDDSDFATFNPESAGPGVHWVYHLIDNNCGDYDSIQITVIGADTAVITPIDDMCYDGPGVQFEATPSGGVWSGNKIPLDGYFDPSLGGIDNYSATYTPEGTCIIIDTEDFIVGDTLRLEADTFYLACFSDTNATLFTDVKGGYDQNYTFDWGPGINNNGPTAINLGRGVYTVDVYDGLGCKESVTHEVIAPPGMFFTANRDIVNPSCTGVCDGTATVYVGGGDITSGSYTYSIQEGTGVVDGGGSFSSLCDGLTVVKIADDNGCFLLDSIILTEPSSILFGATSYTAHCGLSDGSVILDSVVGGTPPYTYFWDNQTTDSNLTNVPQGIYTLTVTDANGCTGTDSYTVNNEAPPTLSFNPTPTTCFGGADGTAKVFVSGGNAPFAYNWDNLMTGDSISNLAAGQYIVQVIDVNGCQVYDSTQIGQPTRVLMNGIADATRCVSQTYELQASAFGGNGGPFTFFTNNGSVYGDSIVASAPGTYLVSAEDSKGCLSDTTSFELIYRDPITLSVTPPQMVCPGDVAQLEVTANGGLGSYAYAWDNGLTSASINYSTGMDGLQDSVWVVVSDGCSPDETIAAVIDFHPPIDLLVDIDPKEGCVPHTVNYQILNNDVQDATWNLGAGIPQVQGLQASNVYFDAGPYFPRVSFTTQYGCQQMEILDTIMAFPIPDGVIAVDPSELDIIFNEAEMRLTTNVDSLLYANWSVITTTKDTLYPGNTPTVEFNFPDVIGVYQIRNDFASEHGCTNFAQKAVKVSPKSTLYVPSAFTPDGDDINDYFSIKYEGIDEIGFDVYIWDRWGTLIYTSKDPDFKWDGKVKGADPKNDVYTWRIRYFETMDIRKEVMGKIMIIK